MDDQLRDKSAQKVNAIKRQVERDDKKRAGYEALWEQSGNESGSEECNQ